MRIFYFLLLVLIVNSLFIEQKRGKYFIFVNEKEGKAYEKVLTPRFSSDGKYLGYGAKLDRELWWIVEEIKK